MTVLVDIGDPSEKYESFVTITKISGNTLNLRIYGNTITTRFTCILPQNMTKNSSVLVGNSMHAGVLNTFLGATTHKIVLVILRS